MVLLLLPTAPSPKANAFIPEALALVPKAIEFTAEVLAFHPNEIALGWLACEFKPTAMPRSAVELALGPIAIASVALAPSLLRFCATLDFTEK